MGKTEPTLSGRWKVEAEELPIRRQPDYLQQYLPAELGYGYSNMFQLDRDLGYIETCYMPSRNLAMASRMDCHEPRLVVTLGMHGKSCFADDRGREIIFEEGYTTITTFDSSRGERFYQASKPVMQLRFSVNKSGLERYLGEDIPRRLFQPGGVHILSHRRSSTHGIIAAQQLLRGKVSRELQQMFMQGVALSILAAELSPLCEVDGHFVKSDNPREEAMAKAAHDILSREFKSPPSVAELSKRVGTNQFKLKQLFHRYFGNTPYGVLLEIRMHKAYQLLQSERCTVNAAADAVGYHHASNFSAAFGKYFGIPPKVVAGR